MRVVHSLNKYEENGRGHWPDVCVLPFPVDSWDVDNTSTTSLLNVGDPSGNDFYQLGISLKQAHHLNFLYRTIRLTDFGVFRRYHDDSRPDWELPDDERYLTGYPGVNIFSFAGGLGTEFGLSIGYPRPFVNAAAVNFTLGNQTIIPAFAQVYPSFFEAPVGVPPDKQNVLYFTSAALFPGQLIYPFIQFAYPNFSGGFGGTVSTYGQWDLRGSSGDFVNSTKFLHVFDWGSIPLYFYYDPAIYNPAIDPKIPDKDIYLTADSFFPYDDAVLGPKWNPSTGASLRPPAYN